jgi:hypothetical protein
VEVAALSQISFVASPLHLLSAEFVDFVKPCLKLLLDGQSDFERQRRHAFYQQLANSTVNLISHDSLAD